MNIHVVGMLSMMAFTSEMVAADPKCVVTSDVATTCDPAPIDKCEACSGFTTNKTACDALTCTWTSAGCSDDCYDNDKDACTTATTNCKWNEAESCQGGCDELLENPCNQAAGCTWNPAVAGECNSPADCTAITTQGPCEDGGCTWTAASTSCDVPLDAAECTGHTTSTVCVPGCEWTEAVTAGCLDSVTCTTHNADESACGGVDGCFWVAATSCTNKQRCEDKDATECAIADNGCTYNAASNCSNVVRAPACTDHTTQNGCCTDTDGCAWVECADNGSGGMLPSLLLLLLLSVNLLIRF